MMTLEDMVESGIELQGVFEIRVFEGERGGRTVVDRLCEPEWGDFDEEDWYRRFPITCLYSDGLGYVIEVDGEGEE